MIVQTAESGSPHFVIRQVDHGRMCGQLARAFGNAAYAAPAPADLMEYVTLHHDEGWRPFDDAPGRDPQTGLPFHLGKAPAPNLVEIGHGSPDFNERHHPFCGLLSAMHYYGVYHDRYGLLPAPTMPNRAPPVEAMLASLLEQAQRLKAALAADPATAPWVAEPHLMQCYSLLQFFDLLALYFNMRHEAARGEAEFAFVPAEAGRAEPVRVRPAEPGVYSLAPYPFRADRLLVDCDGRYLVPVPPEGDLAAAWRAAPVVQQTFVLIAG